MKKALKAKDNGDKKNYEYIPNFLEVLKDRNPGTTTDFATDSAGNFERVFFALGPVANIIQTCGVRLVQYDAAHMKHAWYNGQVYVLEGRDGAPCICGSAVHAACWLLR